MGTVPSNVGVFYGQVDKRAKGWYWADGSEKPRGSIRGPKRAGGGECDSERLGKFTC